MQRAFPTPRGPQVAPLEVLLEKGLPPRHCTGLTDGRGLPASKRLCPPSPVIDFPPPGRSAPPSSHGSAPQDKPSTPALYWSHGRAGLTSVKTVVPSLTGHRLSAAEASNPSLVASPVTALATISPRGASNTRLRLKSHGQCLRRPPRDEVGQATKRSLGARGLDKNEGTRGQRHQHRQNPDAKGVPHAARASSRALGSAPREGPPTPALYWPHGRAGLTSVKTVVPTLTGHRLSAAGAFSPSFVARIGSSRQAFDPSIVLVSRAGGAYQRQNGCALPHRSSTFRRRGVQPVPRRLTCHRACDNQPTRGKQHTPPLKIPRPVPPPSAPGRGRSSNKTISGSKGPQQNRTDRVKPHTPLRKVPQSVHPPRDKPGQSSNSPSAQWASTRTKGQGPTASTPAKSRCKGRSPRRAGLTSRPWKCSSRRASHPGIVLVSRTGGAYQRQNGCAHPHRSSTFRRRGVQPRLRRTDRLLKTSLRPQHCTGLAGGRGLPASKRLCPPSPVIDFPPPGRPTRPSSPHLSPRLRQSAHAGQATHASA